MALPPSSVPTSAARRSTGAPPRERGGEPDRRRPPGRSGTARPRPRRACRRAPRWPATPAPPSRSPASSSSPRTATTARDQDVEQFLGVRRRSLPQHRVAAAPPGPRRAGRVGQRPPQPRLPRSSRGHRRGFRRRSAERARSASRRTRSSRSARPRTTPGWRRPSAPPAVGPVPAVPSQRGTVHGAPAARLVGERLADDLTGEVDRERADLGTQLTHDAMRARPRAAPGRPR